MFSETWFWLYVATKVLGATCPFTSPLGSILSLVGMVARYVFIGILFFLAPRWWYGLVMLLVGWFVPIVLPRINPEDMRNNIGFIYSQVGSHVVPLLVVLMYLYFFNVL